MMVEPDCEDQAMVATDKCLRCRTGFTEEGQPVYPYLVKRGSFWCCPVCHASYGQHPHPELD